MRVKVVTGLLAVLLVVYAGMLVVRGRSPHAAPAPPPPESAAPAASSAAGPASSSAEPSTDAGPPRLMDRPLRVVAMGWDLAAPGLLGNGGLNPGPTSAFSTAGLEVRIAVADTMAAIESMLARGGSDKDGADVALVPLPSFVASYERLRALTPEVFFVAGWSRGREALVSTQSPLTAAPPSGEVRVAGAPGTPASFVALFALDFNGVAANQVRLVDPPPAKLSDVLLAGIDRGASQETTQSRILFTTADASRLVPFVAVAQHGLVEGRAPALSTWARVWLEASRQLATDVPAAARQVAAATGAPEPIALLKRLGETTSSSLNDNARALGLSGRGAPTLERLFQRSWQLWRAAGILVTPAPDVAPIATAIVASLARSAPSIAPDAGPADAGKPASFDRAKAFLVHREPEGKLDDKAFVDAIGVAAGVFEHAPLRVTVKGGGGVDAARTKRAIEAAQGQFDIAPGRLVAGTKPVDKAAAAVEVLAVP